LQKPGSTTSRPFTTISTARFEDVPDDATVEQGVQQVAPHIAAVDAS
jgi:hypothetical protein